MRIGISVASTYAVRDVRDGARWMVERTRAARDAGLDSLFVGDHHATPAPYYQNTAILGRALADWDERPAGALYLLPLWHPVLVAEQVGTLAAIAPGRFILQCALGAGEGQFGALGAEPKQRVARFEESLDLLRRLWAGEQVTQEGCWSIRGARVAPLPPEPVEVWIGAVAPPAIDRAARLADGWLASPHHTPDDARRALDLYASRCSAHGRPLGVAAIRRDVYVGETDEEAAATATPVLERGYRGFPPGAAVVGGPEAVAEAFAALDDMGYSDVIVRNLVPDQAHALACIERLARVRDLLAAS